MFESAGGDEDSDREIGKSDGFFMNGVKNPMFDGISREEELMKLKK